ncbi:MAG: hypothetical protein CFH30_00874 [Alphaproteobacteria bacterium MarineAlpha8_Bin1]|nr:MAG: hypothetical protein CFH30_00874 [Alphaproteobacteria bacterium MarineAlpha8_Bin1]
MNSFNFSNKYLEKLIERKRSNKRRPHSNQRRSGSFRSQKLDLTNNPNRPRGSLSKVLEKYITMAQDANSNGDRVVAENYYQYAEHYQRLINQVGDKKNTHDAKNNSVNKNGEENKNDDRPSRTERAIHAKKERTKETLDSKFESQSIKEKDKNFTSDGIEALKPFEFSLGEKKN